MHLLHEKGVAYTSFMVVMRPLSFSLHRTVTMQGNQTLSRKLHLYLSIHRVKLFTTITTNPTKNTCCTYICK
jgi:hypothetical protein